MANIRIAGKDYNIIDAKEYMTIPDCFVLKNKIGDGHGEAKFYIGNENGETLGFFDDFDRKCFFLKEDIVRYLSDAKNEYLKPEQEYKDKDDLPALWTDLMSEAESLSREIVFNIYRSNVEPPRVYINSEADIYKFLRKIALPNISYLSVLKLSLNGEMLYYFKPFIDYYYLGEVSHPSLIKEEEEEIRDDSSIPAIEKEQLTKARIGQGKYRDDLLCEIPYCMVTKVTEERLLIASHIKPWVDADYSEKLDSKNGLTLTPTYDKLFDRGFISFDDNGRIMISPWLSPMNQRKLGLTPAIAIDLVDAKRRGFMQYHREHIFKG